MGGQELAGILDDLERGFNGDAWHGPSLQSARGCDRRACIYPAHPGRPQYLGDGRHLSAWDEVVGKRISEQRPIDSPERGDFPPVTDTTATAWSDALSELHRQHSRLVQIVSGLDEVRLRETVAGKSYSTAHMIRGVLQHMAYHAGQIALIRKVLEAQRSNPAS